MKSHDIVPAFVLGILRSVERDLVLRRRLYDRKLDAEICALEDVLSAFVPKDLGLQPDEFLWRRICDAVTHEQCLAACGSFACLDGGWESGGPGIDCKPLWSDKAILIRCSPGAFEEAHAQPLDEDEHIVVIAGELVIGTRVLCPGDYVRIPAASLHARMHTVTGCLIFTQHQPVVPSLTTPRPSA